MSDGPMLETPIKRLVEDGDRLAAALREVHVRYHFDQKHTGAATHCEHEVCRGVLMAFAARLKGDD